MSEIRSIKTGFWVLWSLVLAFGAQALAMEAPPVDRDQLTCVGFVSYVDGSYEKLTLDVASYDKDFLDAKTEEISFLVDMYYLPKQAVNLMIYDLRNAAYTTVVAGFRPIAGSKKIYEARLTYKPPQDPLIEQAQLVCVVDMDL